MAREDHDAKDCLKMFEKLSEYVDNELDAASCREVEAHIQDCVKCNVCLETLRRTIEICKKMEDKPVPDLFSRRLRELIQSLQ